MTPLIEKLQRDLYSKELPGVVLLNLREKWLETFLKKHTCNQEALLLGFMLCDYKLQEATMLRKTHEHTRMASDHARQLFLSYELPPSVQEIVLEMIETHHTGTQKFIEAKLLRNAECMADLEPKGILHTFGRNYTSYTESSFTDAFKYLFQNAQKKVSVVDLDQETVDEARSLFERLEWMKTRIDGY